MKYILSLLVFLFSYAALAEVSASFFAEVNTSFECKAFLNEDEIVMQEKSHPELVVYKGKIGDKTFAASFANAARGNLTADLQIWDKNVRLVKSTAFVPDMNRKSVNLETVSGEDHMQIFCTTLTE